MADANLANLLEKALGIVETEINNIYDSLDKLSLSVNPSNRNHNLTRQAKLSDRASRLSVIEDNLKQSLEVLRTSR